MEFMRKLERAGFHCIPPEVRFQELNLTTYNIYETYPEFVAQESHAWVAFQFECPSSGLRGQPVEVSRGLTDFE